MNVNPVEPLHKRVIALELYPENEYDAELIKCIEKYCDVEVITDRHGNRIGYVSTVADVMRLALTELFIKRGLIAGRETEETLKEEILPLKAIF